MLFTHFLLGVLSLLIPLLITATELSEHYRQALVERTAFNLKLMGSRPDQSFLTKSIHQVSSPTLLVLCIKF